MQVLWECPVTDEDYVTERAWERATVECCAFHPEGGCGLEKLGSYPRVSPAGARVPRWWCPKRRESISLLPSFLAARLSGTLAAVEETVATVEEAGGIVAAVEEVHPAERDDAIGLVGALRRLRRRVAAVRAALVALTTLLPELAGVRPTLAALREALSLPLVLERLRLMAVRHLGALPAPLGFAARSRR